MTSNGRQSNSRLTSPAQPAPTTPARGGLFVHNRFAESAAQQRVTDRSLQINIDSMDDAKSVIQNLSAIKSAYDAAHGDLTSVEFCIAESVAKEAEKVLIGAIPWCRTYVKHIAPQPGNVLFPLPSFKDLSLVEARKPAPIQTPAPESTTPAAPVFQSHVKPQRPVRAESGRV